MTPRQGQEPGVSGDRQQPLRCAAGHPGSSATTRARALGCSSTRASTPHLARRRPCHARSGAGRWGARAGWRVGVPRGAASPAGVRDCASPAAGPHGHTGARRRAVRDTPFLRWLRSRFVRFAPTGHGPRLRLARYLSSSERESVCTARGRLRYRGLKERYPGTAASCTRGHSHVRRSERTQGESLTVVGRDGRGRDRERVRRLAAARVGRRFAGGAGCARLPDLRNDRFERLGGCCLVRVDGRQRSAQPALRLGG